MDLTDKYVFAKTGAYTIRFKGEGNRIPGSNKITVEVTPGKLSELDQTVIQLLPIRPKGWFVTKTARGEHQVAPFGRARVLGYGAHICRNYMRGEALYVWITKAEAAIAPDKKPRLKSKYLGRTGGLYVYIAEDLKISSLWPKAVEEVSRVLHIVKE